MPPRSASSLLHSVKKTPQKKSSWLTGAVASVTIIGTLGLLGMEAAVIRSHSQSRQAVLQKKVVVSQIRQQVPQDRRKEPQPPLRAIQPNPTPLLEENHASVLPNSSGMCADVLDLLALSATTFTLRCHIFAFCTFAVMTVRSEGRETAEQNTEDMADADSGIGGLEPFEEELEEEKEEEALQKTMGALDAAPGYTEPPIVQPLSGKQHKAVSVVSHKQRKPDTGESFVFSGDLPESDLNARDVSAVYSTARAVDTKARANDAVARAKEKVAMAKAKGARKMGRG